MSHVKPLCPKCGGTNIFRSMRAWEIAVLKTVEDDGEVVVYHTEEPYFRKMAGKPVYHCDECNTKALSWQLFVPRGLVHPGAPNDDPAVII